jgi:hypothetical protein
VEVIFPFPYHSLLASCFCFLQVWYCSVVKSNIAVKLMTEDNSLQDNEERNNLLLTSRSVAAAWDGFLVRLRNLVLYVIYGITDVFHLWYGWPREP